MGSKGSLIFDDTKDWANKLIINPSYLNKEKKIIYKPEKAIEVIQSVLKSFSQVTNDPRPQVGIEGFGDSSIDIGVRYWAPSNLYFQTLYAVNLAIFNQLKQAGITIPFPQRDVHFIQNPNGDGISGIASQQQKSVS